MNLNRNIAHPRDTTAFTLIELVAVATIIMLLAVVTLGVAKWAGSKSDISQTRADLAGLEVAIEKYRLDKGTYPTSSLIRVSCVQYTGTAGSLTTKFGPAEVINSGLLYAQLTAGSDPYYRFRPSSIKTTPTIVYIPGTPDVAFTNTGPIILDRWGTPINYFCTYPRITTATPFTSTSVNGSKYYCATGTQASVEFELFSYGPDASTYLPVTGTSWNNPALATDDITTGK